jgi:hypothetical protein
MSALSDMRIVHELRRAWEESNPATADSREQGGFILRHGDGPYLVARWPHGGQDRIEVPEHSGGHFAGAMIVATFHTHPNPGPDYQQEPSLTDIRAVRDDPHLKHTGYEGEYVISQETVYRIHPDGTVELVGDRASVLFPGEGAE